MAPVAQRFTTQPAVVVRDAGGNVAAGAVTLALAPGFGTPDATLACDGGNTVSTVGGTATFTGCRVDRAGPGYRLLATVSGSTASDASASFDVTVGAATQLAFTTSPGGGTGGTSWAVQPVVAVLDAGGNAVVDAAVAVDLAVPVRAGPLECASDPLAVVSGSAFFTGCSIDVAGTGYTLTAAAAGLTSTTSAPFDVTVGAPGRTAVHGRAERRHRPVRPSPGSRRWSSSTPAATPCRWPQAGSPRRDHHRHRHRRVRP